MIVSDVRDLSFPSVFLRVFGLLDESVQLLLKLEGFNAAGSIKLKTALGIVRDLESGGLLRPGATLIETTSGNMGIALCVVAKACNYGFICVSDEKMTEHNRRVVRAYGAELVIMDRSTLAERCAYIRDRITAREDLVWTRQFSNESNPAVHERTTAMEILREVPTVNHLFVGTGTGGTLTGCARVFAERSPSTVITAVDAVGSRHFDRDRVTVQRRIPGIGASERSPFLDCIRIDNVVAVSDEDTIAHCHLLLDRTGWMLGGSSGSVLAAILHSRNRFQKGDTVVGICADFGERYLDVLYDASPAVIAGQSGGGCLATTPQ